MKLFKKLSTIVLPALLFFAACNQPAQPVEVPNTETPVDHTSVTATVDTTTPATLDYLRGYAGKKASEVNLLNDAALTARIVKLATDKRFEFMKQNWNAEEPITVDKDVFIAKACKTNECGRTEFIILVDFSRNVVFAGLKENGQVETYSENGTINQKMMDWAAHSTE